MTAAQRSTTIAFGLLATLATAGCAETMCGAKLPEDGDTELTQCDLEGGATYEVTLEANRIPRHTEVPAVEVTGHLQSPGGEQLTFSGGTNDYRDRTLFDQEKGEHYDVSFLLREITAPDDGPYELALTGAEREELQEGRLRVEVRSPSSPYAVYYVLGGFFGLVVMILVAAGLVKRLGRARSSTV